jgi:hypothetical protein
MRARDLHGINLHGADLRGVDLTASNLREADLSGVVTGRPVQWTLALGAAGVAFSWLLGIVAGRIAAHVRGWLQSGDPRYRAAAFFIAAELILFLGVLLWKGTAVALTRVTAVAVAVAAVVGLLGVATGLGSGRAAVFALILIAVAAAIVLLGTVARITAGTGAPWLFYLSAMGGGLMGREAGGGVLVVAIAIVAAIVGRRALRGDRRDAALSRWAEALSCLGGTRFRGADLLGANLRGAKLKNSDFRDATLEASQLESAEEVASCAFDRRRAAPGSGRPSGA